VQGKLNAKDDRQQIAYVTPVTIVCDASHSAKRVEAGNCTARMEIEIAAQARGGGNAEHRCSDAHVVVVCLQVRLG
jgi:hypothetical protein